MINAGGQFGRTVGARAASPYGGAGGLAEDVVNAPQRAASHTYPLLRNTTVAKKPASSGKAVSPDLRMTAGELKTSDIERRRAKPQSQAASKSLRLWVRK